MRELPPEAPENGPHQRKSWTGSRRELQNILQLNMPDPRPPQIKLCITTNKDICIQWRRRRGGQGGRVPPSLAAWGGYPPLKFASNVHERYPFLNVHRIITTNNVLKAKFSRAFGAT